MFFAVLSFFAFLGSFFIIFLGFGCFLGLAVFGGDIFFLLGRSLVRSLRELFAGKLLCLGKALRDVFEDVTDAASQNGAQSVQGVGRDMHVLFQTSNLAGAEVVFLN